MQGPPHQVQDRDPSSLRFAGASPSERGRLRSARLQTCASTGSERQAAKPREFEREIEEVAEIEAFMVTLTVRRRMNVSKRLRRVRTHTISSISSASSISL